MTELTFSSKPYKLTPAIYFRMAAGAKLPTLAATAILTLLVAAAAAVLVDLRMIFIGLIIVFLVIPFVVVNIYFKKLLTPQARYALARKRIVVEPDDSLIEIFLPESDEDVEESIPPRVYTRDKIKGVRRSGGYIAFSIDPDYLLIVPVNDREEAEDAV